MYALCSLRLCLPYLLSFVFSLLHFIFLRFALFCFALFLPCFVLLCFTLLCLALLCLSSFASPCVAFFGCAWCFPSRCLNCSALIRPACIARFARLACSVSLCFPPLLDLPVLVLLVCSVSLLGLICLCACFASLLCFAPLLDLLVCLFC